MLFNLLLTSITILLFFSFYFLLFLKFFFRNPDVIENVRPQLSLVIPVGAPITDTNDAIEMLLASTDKKKLMIY